MFSFQSVFVEGRLNFGRVIVPDLVSSNGVVQVIDTMLIPPTAELGLTIYDRIARTPWLKVHEEILLLLGEFLLILVRAISMTACFVYRARTRISRLVSTPRRRQRVRTRRRRLALLLREARVLQGGVPEKLHGDHVRYHDVRASRRPRRGGV